MKSKLAFIMGPPRSGTTAITRLLMSHPDVLLADTKVLNTALPDAPTYYESGIFVRDLSDEEIVARFQALDGQAKIIVEKTPSHVEHIDRIRRLFPQALLIVTHREPFGCMKSWKVANRKFIQSSQSFAQSCRAWNRATRIATANIDARDAMLIDFAEFMADPSTKARDIFQRLELRLEGVEACVAAMNSKSTERIKDVVGETVRGGNSKLSLFEWLQVRILCQNVEAKWISATKTE